MCQLTYIQKDFHEKILVMFTMLTDLISMRLLGPR